MFEYDSKKSAANRVKHGIDFEQAQALWDDPQRLEIPARTDDERRFVLIGRIDQTHWAAVTTPRPPNTRIISVRRARREEVLLYESTTL